MAGLWKFDENGEVVRIPEEVECNPKVGIFWIIKEGDLEELIADAVPYEAGALHEGVQQYGDHFEYWQSLQPKTQAEEMLKSKRFDHYSRGHVDYNPGSKTFLLYADLCLSAEDLTAAFEMFDFGDFDFKMMDEDVRYQCARCNPALR